MRSQITVLLADICRFSPEKKVHGGYIHRQNWDIYASLFQTLFLFTLRRSFSTKVFGGHWMKRGNENTVSTTPNALFKNQKASFKLHLRRLEEFAARLSLSDRSWTLEISNVHRLSFTTITNIFSNWVWNFPSLSGFQQSSLFFVSVQYILPQPVYIMIPSKFVHFSHACL